MSLAPDRGLQVRIAGALALVVVVNGLLLAAIAWSLLQVLSASGQRVSIELGLPVTVGALLIEGLLDRDGCLNDEYHVHIQYFGNGEWKLELIDGIFDKN